LKEIPYGENRWFISLAVLLKDIPYGENRLRRLAFAIEGNPLREIRWFISLAVLLKGIPYGEKQITPFGICY